MSAPRRVVVHVGAPKTGTTFLQRTLWRHRAGLNKQDFTVPGTREREMFHAAIEVRESYRFWGLEPEDLAGTWRRLCQEAKAYPGSTIMSHELLAAATEQQAARALAELEDEEVHLVYTARDLVRQVTSEWQERVKNGGVRTLESMLEGLARQVAQGDFSHGFWRSHDPVGVLDRWAAELPPDRVHVVVCPPSGRDPLELWHRFGEACGFDAHAIDPQTGRAPSNQTLGVVEASLLRQVNEALEGRLRKSHYYPLVKQQFAQRILPRLSSPPPRCPADLAEGLRAVAVERNEVLRARGYRIHGDLADLVPPVSDDEGVTPADVDPADELHAAVAVIAEMLLERAERADAASVAALQPQPTAPARAEEPDLAPPAAVRPTSPTRPRPRRGGGANHPRVFLHVGSPKTGTTFLQNVLWRQRDLAADQGLLLPGERFHDHFLATLDVRGLAGVPPHPAEAVGSWDRLVEEALAWSGPVLVSHELFAGASLAQARQAVRRLSEQAEVHVVVTARDLVRQLTAEWQEHVKHRSTRTLADFVEGIRRDHERRSWFWLVQDFADVAERWGGGLAKDRVHVVTVPRPGQPADLLWQRFAGVLGIDSAAFDTAVARSNTSLGLEQTELLRRVNLELGDRLPIPGPYPGVVKDILAHKVLAARSGTSLELSQDDVLLAVEESRRIADRIGELGFTVVGDLDELVPEKDGPGHHDANAAYATPAAELLLDEGVAALADLLVELSERRTAQQRQRERLQFAERSPVKFALARASERHATLMKARSAYRRMQRR